MERTALGKGLSALIPEGTEKNNTERVKDLEVIQIVASKFQPREYFSENRLKELASSIKEKGVIQPILVRAKGDKFELIAGERRLRAAKLLNLKTIPAIVKDVNDGDLLELSIIENVQREELNRIEEARAYNRLSQEFDLTHDVIAKKVGKDRTTISNLLRILDLPQKIQDQIEENILSLGHAKALLMLDNPKEQQLICNTILKKSLSVRQAEELIRKRASGVKRSAKRNKDIHTTSIEEKLQHHFGTRVKIEQGKKRGKIQIEYFSSDDFNRILDLILPGNQG